MKPRLVAFAAAVLACNAREQWSGDTSAPVGHTRVAQSTDTAVTERGMGPVRIGMTLAQVRAALPGLDVPKEGEKGDCAYARGPGLPAGVKLMVENSVVVRIDVDTTTVPTAEGASVGDPITRIKSIYGARVSAAPNEYSEEPELTVRASEAGDTLHELVFETLEGTVVKFRAGQRPQVRYVEGCS